MTTIEIFEWSDPKTIVHSIPVSNPSNVNRVVQGMAINFDFDTYGFRIEESA